MLPKCSINDPPSASLGGSSVGKFAVQSCDDLMMKSTTHWPLVSHIRGLYISRRLIRIGRSLIAGAPDRNLKFSPSL